MERSSMPKFNVWVYDLPDEYDLKVAARSGQAVSVHMMRRRRMTDDASLVYRVPASLKVLDVKDRRRSGTAKREVGSMHRELAVEVEMVKDAPKGILNSCDDGLGLSAFKAGTQFTLVYCPDDRTRTARVSRSSDVLYVQPDVADESPPEAEDATET